MQAVFDTLKWPSSIQQPKFYCQGSDGKGVISRSGNGASTEGKREFTFANALFADDCALSFGSRAEIEVGASHFFLHLKKLGLNMHVGRPGDTAVSKTVAIYFPNRSGSAGTKDRIHMVDEIGNACHIDFAESIKYLGTIIHSSLTSKADVTARIKQANKIFGASNSLLMGKLLNIKTKGKVFVSLVLSTLLYGSECWIMTAEIHSMLTKFFNKCVRRMCKQTYWYTTKCQHIHSYDLRKRLGIKSLDDYLVSRLLRWIGSVSRLDPNRSPRMLMTAEVNLRRPRGSIKTPHSTWKRYLGAVDQTLEGLQAAAADRAAWIKATEVVTKPLYKTSSKFMQTAIAQPLPQLHQAQPMMLNAGADAFIPASARVPVPVAVAFVPGPAVLVNELNGMVPM